MAGNNPPYQAPRHVDLDLVCGYLLFPANLWSPNLVTTLNVHSPLTTPPGHVSLDLNTSLSIRIMLTRSLGHDVLVVPHKPFAVLLSPRIYRPHRSSATQTQ